MYIINPKEHSNLKNVWLNNYLATNCLACEDVVSLHYWIFGLDHFISTVTSTSSLPGKRKLQLKLSENI